MVAVMFERFTDEARRVLSFARDEAMRSGSSRIETQHVLFGVIIGDEVLIDRFLGSPAATHLIRKHISSCANPSEQRSTSLDPPFSAECKRAFVFAAHEAGQLGENLIGPEHLLLGLMRDGQNLAAKLLNDNELTPQIRSGLTSRPDASDKTAAATRPNENSAHGEIGNLDPEDLLERLDRLLLRVGSLVLTALAIYQIAHLHLI
jgi:ATP-dependent Clp protease ATP-binding subunit ClpA